MKKEGKKGGGLRFNEPASNNLNLSPSRERKKTSKVMRYLSNRVSSDISHRFKVILLGDSKVGKTSIIRQLVEETFNRKY